MTLPLAARIIRCRKVLTEQDPFSRHQYENVDTEIVIMILRKHLDDFLLFRDAVLQMFNDAKR